MPRRREDRVTNGREYDIAGITALFAAISPELERRARRRLQGDRAAAEDLVQEVFHDVVRFWQRVKDLDLDQQRAWLFRALDYEVIDRWRAPDVQRVAPTGQMPEIRGAHDETCEKALNGIALDRCWAAIKAMPPTQHRAAVLRWGMGWSTQGIATHLGTTPGTIRVHLHNARVRLRHTVGPEVTFLDETDQDGEEADSWTSPARRPHTSL
jgi:RNA polymerase sigma-70 factor, ECF subfamily